jgi:hypothetical protein
MSAQDRVPASVAGDGEARPARTRRAVRVLRGVVPVALAAGVLAGGLAPSAGGSAPPTQEVVPVAYTQALPYGPDTCKSGWVWREARAGDHVCVTPANRTITWQENSLAASRRQPGGGAYGPDTCKNGYVWREAFASDLVCVTPDRRTQAKDDNAHAAERREKEVTTPLGKHRFARVNSDVDLYDAPGKKKIGILRTAEVVGVVKPCDPNNWCQLSAGRGWAWGSFLTNTGA